MTPSRTHPTSVTPTAKNREHPPPSTRRHFRQPPSRGDATGIGAPWTTPLRFLPSSPPLAGCSSSSCGAPPGPQATARSESLHGLPVAIQVDPAAGLPHSRSRWSPARVAVHASSPSLRRSCPCAAVRDNTGIPPVWSRSGWSSCWTVPWCDSGERIVGTATSIAGPNNGGLHPSSPCTASPRSAHSVWWLLPSSPVWRPGTASAYRRADVARAIGIGPTWRLELDRRRGMRFAAAGSGRGHAIEGPIQRRVSRSRRPAGGGP
jgi:hypothetical protein